MPDATQLQELWDDLYDRRQEAWLTVRSGSMAPMIQIGDRVQVKQIEPQQIHFGDIIVFTEAGKMVVHRVMGRRGNDQNIIFLQKGDTNTIAAYILAENVIGKVACIRKGNRHIRLDSFLGRHANLLLGVSFYVFYLLRERRLASRLVWLFRYCLNILFRVR
jgi:signal peptidase I